MSEPKLISPMLDNFAMGAPISEHDGVRCCPALEQYTDKKYIVKIISVPASQRQLEALLLSGAYPDQESAANYFRSITEDIVEEAKVLQKLARLEGFIPYDSWQVEPMEDATGFDVYLMSAYKRSLARHVQRTPLSQLGALNLSLDICNALAVCRRSGYLYVDLKPENIYITDEQEFKIGDLGFQRLDSLKYASLPDKYRSAYTAPEIADAYSSLNETIDIYAAGLILYQIYNGGQLPFEGNAAPNAAFPAPAYADQEMAEIILKACAPEPADRWQNPVQMGHALVSYMQRNGVNDVPIIPAPVEEAPPEDAAEPETAETEPVYDEDAVGAFEAPAEVSEEATEAEISQEMDAEQEVSAEEAPEEAASEEAAELFEDDFGNLSFLEDVLNAEELPEDEQAAISYDELSADVSDMLSQADELATATVPDPVIPPEPIDVPMPEPLPIVVEEPPADEPQEKLQEEPQEEAVVAAPAAEAEESVSEEEPEEDEDFEEEYEDEEYWEEPVKKRRGGWIGALIALILLAGLLFGGYYFYENYYLQTIDSIYLSGDEDRLTVMVNTNTDETLLQVICSDSYGNQLTAPVVDGKAAFTGLVSNTAYTVSIEIKGFHKLVGQLSGIYSTPVQTGFVQINAVTGNEDGSVILSFTINGPDAKKWIVSYSAPGEAERQTTFSGHMVTVTGLTPGLEYTFTLTPEDDLYISGNNQVKFTASKLIYAQDLKITACNNRTLTAVWKAPAGVEVANWTVRCYNDSGYNQTMVVTETTATFTGLDHARAYTVEVTAAGMSLSQNTYLAANSLTISNFKADFSNPTKLKLTWASNMPVAQDGWVLLYSIADSDVRGALPCSENSATIAPVVPGATYNITLQAANGSTIFDGSFTCTAPSAKIFSCAYEGFTITGENMIFSMCKTPAVDNWDRWDLDNSDYTNTFSAGQKASFLVRMTKEYGRSNDLIEILFVIRDSSGKLISAASYTSLWIDMWYQNYCELNVPGLPSTAGNYTISVYFNSGLAAQQDFTVRR